MDISTILSRVEGITVDTLETFRRDVVRIFYVYLSKILHQENYFQYKIKFYTVIESISLLSIMKLHISS